jgi:chromosomal replication initiator protein
MKSVAQFFEISQADIINKSRRKQIVLPRQIAMFLMREMLGMSYPDIGDKLGKRDHTTAIHSYEKISREITANRKLNQTVVLVKELINKTSSSPQ